MKKIKYLGLLILFVLVFTPKLSMAVFSINTFYIALDDKTRNSSVTVFNNSNVPQGYEVKLLHAKQNHDGSYTPITKEEDGVKFADPYVIYTPQRFTVGKRSSQIVRLQKRPMSKAANGEYLSLLLVRELPKPPAPVTEEEKIVKTSKDKKQKMQLTLTPIFGISLPLVVRKGPDTATAEIKDIKITNSDKDKGKSEIITRISRDGNYSTRGDVIVTIGKKKIAELKGINIFVGNDYRDLTLDVDSKTLAQYKGKGSLNVKYVSVINGKVLASKDLSL